MDEKKTILDPEFYKKAYEEEKKANQALRQELNQAREVLTETREMARIFKEQALFGLYIIQEGKLVYLNDFTAKLTEYSVEEMLGWDRQEVSKVIHPDDRRFVMEQARKKEEGRSDDIVSQYEHRLVTKSGKTKWVRLFSRQISHMNKPALMAVTVEITKHKKAEDALRESEEKYRNVVQNALEAICVIQDGRFKYFNPKAVKLFGYAAEELEHLPSEDTIYPKDRALVTSRRLQKESGEPVLDIYSHRIITGDGRIRWVEIKSVTITWNSEPAILVFLTDITERKRSEELMIQSEKMMSVGGLAAGMAHEINNPLGVILQGTQIILRRFSPEFKKNLVAAEKYKLDLSDLQYYLKDRGILDYLTAIQESGKKAAKIITEMLRFSRKSESKMAPVDIVRVLEKSLELGQQDYDLKKKFDFRNIKIEKDFEAHSVMVPCMETEIEQVILNLLKNAAQSFTEKTVKEQPTIILRVKIEKDMAIIEVEDNGPGIHESIKKRIFEPFFTTKPIGLGTGLGLSVSYMIISNNHGGTMEVESEFGTGSKFIIRLPLESELMT